jgi:hypothetical protein
MDRRNRGACQRLGQHTYIHTVNNCELRCYILYRGLYYYMCIALCVRALCSTQTLSSISCDIIIFYPFLSFCFIIEHESVSRSNVMCVSFCYFYSSTFLCCVQPFRHGEYFFFLWLNLMTMDTSGDWEIARAIGIYYIILYHRPSAAAL